MFSDLQQFCDWWRRGELNPCPKTHPCNFLRAYFTYKNSLQRLPVSGQIVEVVRIQFSGTDTPENRSPLIDAQATAAVICRRTEADLSCYQCTISSNCNIISSVYI